MPATTGSYLIAGAGLTGVLPLGCFWCFGLLVDGLWANYPWLVPVVLLTNALTAFNLVRVFRQVFLDKPHPKTKRTPEVNWLMALPMVSLAVVVLLVPLIFHRIYPIAGVEVVSLVSMVAVVVSSLVGVVIASGIALDKFGSRSVFKPLRTLQDLLAYDFYTERFYRSTVVAFVAFLARITDAFDRLLLNRFVNRVGTSSMVSAEGLRLAVSGQTQSYVLTVLLAIVLLLSALVWWRAA